MRLEISVAASLDLREMHRFGLDRYGGRQADSYLDEILAKFDVIAQRPLAARQRMSRGRQVRLSTHSAHNIHYLVDGETILILRVVHHSVNWIDLL